MSKSISNSKRISKSISMSNDDDDDDNDDDDDDTAATTRQELTPTP